MTTRLLYVDDEDDIREVAAMALELDPELEVRTCSSGFDALVAAAEWQPAIILLDVMMPGMDGPTTLARLRCNAVTAAIPVVFITARTQAHEVEKFKEMGVKGVIAKPFDPMTLAVQARAHLD
ncbi:response regulator [Allosphingosinicella flava]|uniref:Response regulator n=1 Tax=Allosphingosinicella flava TaxID=2771430 RepID=A0A7T2GLN6_9SPHN|nr:response regulator [Sphingosinicella flava]QPQ56150.1 response regulator [Sphingosinicella flava]